MRRLFAFAAFLAAAGFLLREHLRPPPLSAPAEPPASAEAKEPSPIFSAKELEKIRQSMQDPDPEVRWTAVQLLYSIRDPRLGELLDQMIADDPDPELRIKAVGLMKGREDLVRLGALVKGLQDFDKGVRLASLKTIGDIGDPSVTTWVTALLKDVDPEIRVAALQALGRFQDKRKEEFKVLADKLRRDYEEALRRSVAKQQ